MTWFAPAARAAMDDAHVLPGLSLAGLARPVRHAARVHVGQGGPQ